MNRAGQGNQRATGGRHSDGGGRGGRGRGRGPATHATPHTTPATPGPPAQGRGGRGREGLGRGAPGTVMATAVADVSRTPVAQEAGDSWVTTATNNVVNTDAYPLRMEISEPPDPADESAYSDWKVKAHAYWDLEDWDLEFSDNEVEYVDFDGTVYPITPERPFAHPDPLASPGRPFTGPGHRLPPASPDQPFPKVTSNKL
jgi:hypothetical protein